MVIDGARCTSHPAEKAEANCARCGDFVCRMCGPLEPVALCPRCAIKTTLEWEEPGENGPIRAFLITAREAIGSPSRVGDRLGGSGHVLSALSYVTLAALCGLLPLATLFAAPIVGIARPLELGLRSTSALSVAVFLVLLAIAVPTLIALGVSVLSLLISLLARSLRMPVRYDVTLRGLAYGMSMLAIPLLGPILLPVALAQALLVSHAQLSQRGDVGRATLVLALAGASLAVLSFALAFVFG